MDYKIVVVIISVLALVAECEKSKKGKHKEPVACTCGIFLSGQLKKTPKSSPKGDPVLTQGTDNHYPNNAKGHRQCANKCLENIVGHLPKSADIICATLNRDCYKEKAYLFTMNNEPKWLNSNMNAGREFCCKDNLPYKCPIL